MDAISLLKADHKKVGELLDKVEALSDGAHVSRQRLFEQIAQELTVHSQVEETIFYPAVKARTKRDTDPSDEVLEAYEEHANVKSMLEKLRGLDPAEETYNAKLQVLGDLVRHHVKEEETVLFKQARELLDRSELEELGDELAAAKEEMLQATT